MHDDDEDYEDDDLPEGVYHDDEWQTVPCPECRAEIAEGSEQCPRCGYFLSREDHPRTPRSWFWWVMMALAILATVACFA